MPSSVHDPRDPHEHSFLWMGWWILASILLHLFLISTWSILPKSLLKSLRTTNTTPVDHSPALTLMMMTPQPPAEPKPKIQPHQIIQTLPSQAVEKENPDAILESDKNTQLLSKERGTLNDSPLPQQLGDEKSPLSFVDTPESRPTKASGSSGENQPQPSLTPPAPPSEDPDLHTKSPIEKHFLSPDGVPIFPSNSAPKPSPNIPYQTQTEKTKGENRPKSPSSPMSFAKDKSIIAGSKKSDFGESSPEAKATDLGRYKTKIYKSIGSRWYIMVDQQMGMLAIGAVKIRFFVQANGVIRDIEVSEESGRTEILENVSIRSVRDSGPFEPFTDNLKQQLGEGYWEEITFSIY